MLKLGRHSYDCGSQLRGDMNDVIVGNFSSIARDVIWDCGFSHNIKMVTTFPLHKLDSSLKSNIKSKGSIHVGSDVTIGERAIIMSGVTIGDGAVIGANTVVTKDVPPMMVYAGGKMWWRFEPQFAMRVLDIAWWNWTDERILANAHLLLSEDINNFIQNHI